MGFEINVTLSTEAATKLAAQKEGIVALASYFEDPKKTTKKYADEVDMIS